MVAMVTRDSPYMGRGDRRPAIRMERRRPRRQSGRKILPFAVGADTTRPLLNSFYPDSEFRRRAHVNLPLAVFVLLALVCFVMVVWSLRQ